MSEIQPPAGFTLEGAGQTQVKPPPGFELETGGRHSDTPYRPTGPVPGDADYKTPAPKQDRTILGPILDATLPQSILKHIPTNEQALEGLQGILESQAGLGSALPTAAKAAVPVGKAAMGAAAAAGKGAAGLGRLATDVVGNVGTQTGGESLRQAVKAGYEGGKSAESFLGALRGKTDMGSVVQAAKDAISKMRLAKSSAYRSGMLDVSKDKSVLDFKDIDKALADSEEVGTFKGETINKAATDTLASIKSAVEKWKSLAPAEFHSAEGFDALKQQIGAIRETTEAKTQARLVADEAYKAVSKTISQQTPKYAEVMKDYHDASEQVRELDRAFSMGDKASQDTALRKLQSVMRNNVSTNYGNRLKLAEKIDKAGNGTVLPQLAGHALSSYTPRGLGQMVAGGEIVGGFENPALWAALPFQSPRVMGEVAHGVGAGAGKVRDILQALGMTSK